MRCYNTLVQLLSVYVISYQQVAAGGSTHLWKTAEKAFMETLCNLVVLSCVSG